MFTHFFEKDFDKCIEDLISIHNRDTKEIERLNKINKQLSDKKYKDKELQRLKNEMDGLISIINQSFTIDDEELKLLRAWENDHEHKDFYYKFVPTAIGDSGSVVCAKCGAEFEFKEIR